LLAATSTSGRTFGSVERVCPFTGTKFNAEIDASGTRLCQRLDLKPIGFIGAPAEVPVCPDDGFVVFKERFSTEEVNRLRPWVESEEFREMTRTESEYYRIAQTLRRLGEPSDEVAWQLVQASWQVEKDREKYRRYVGEAVRELLAAAATTSPPASGREPALRPEVAAVLASELERRTGQLEHARARLQQLKQKPGLPSTLVEVIDWELELVAAGDTSAHYLPRESEERCSRSD
jgi:hypothetical protein